MELKQGTCIRSIGTMDDPHFIDATILITEMNKDGAMGFVVNQPFERRLNELAEFSNSKSFPLYTGGPVDREHLYFIHRQPSLISNGQLVARSIYTGGQFKEALAAMNAGLLTTSDIKIFVGYCGWDTGELEIEAAEGSWEVIGFLKDEIFR